MYVVKHINGPSRLINSKNENKAKNYYLRFVLKDYRKWLKIENIYKLYIDQNDNIDHMHKNLNKDIQNRIIEEIRYDIFTDTTNYYFTLCIIYMLFIKADAIDKLREMISIMGNVKFILDHSLIFVRVPYAMTDEFSCKYYPYKKMVNTKYKYILKLLMHYI